MTTTTKKKLSKVFSYGSFLRRQRGDLRLGTTTRGTILRLLREHLATHGIIWASTGAGKSFLVRGLIRQLLPCGYSISLGDRKGELADAIIEDFAALGLADQLDVYDTTRPDKILHFNPYADVGLHPRHHALAFTRSVLSCWGQKSGNVTPQMIRTIYNSAVPALEFHGTIKDSIEMLNYENKAARRRLLARTSDPEVKDEWQGFERLSATQRRQETAPAYARLKKFIVDPVIEKSMLGYPSFNMAASMREGRHRIYKFVGGDPLESENADLLESLWNESEYLTAVREKDRPPIVLIRDEGEELLRINPEIVKNIWTYGRTRGIYLWLICHNLQQIMETDPGMLSHIMAFCRTKIIGAGVGYNDLKLLAPELFIDQWHSQIVRYDTVLPVGISKEEAREIISHSEQEGWSEETSVGSAFGTALMHALTTSEQEGGGVTDTEGEGEQWNWTHGETDSQGEQEGWSDMTGFSATDNESSHSADTSSKWKNAGEDTGSEGHVSGAGKGHGETSNAAFTLSGGRHRQHAVTDTEGYGRSRQRSHAVSRNYMKGIARQLANTISRMTTQGSSRGRSGSKGTSRQVVPFTKTYYENMVTSRQFLESQPFLEEKIARMRRLENRWFAIKVEAKRTVLFRSEDVRSLLRDPGRVGALWDSLFARPYYGDLQKPAVQVLLPEDDDAIEY